MSFIRRRFTYANVAMTLTLRRRVLWLCAVSCLLLLGVLPAVAAAEEETHLFNATLSLTGDCSVSPNIDPVPDPGCPGGAHPSKPFARDNGIAVDRYGDRYVASAGVASDGSEGRVDVFGPTGTFITEISVTLPYSGASLAVDSQGDLYLARQFEDGSQRVLMYAPTTYNPAAGEIGYWATPVAIPYPLESWSPGAWGSWVLVAAVNPANDHLLIAQEGSKILEFASAAEGNTYIQAIPLEEMANGGMFLATFAVDGAHKRIYVADLKETVNATSGRIPPAIRAYNLEAPHELLFTFDGSATPTERFVSETKALPLAVDETSGHIFVGDLEAPTRRVYEFDSEGHLTSTIEGPLQATSTPLAALPLQIAYDNSPTSPTDGFLFVPSGSGPGRSMAFGPKSLATPSVEGLSVSGLTSSDAILRGKVNPGGVVTTYRVEYATEQAFLVKGFEGAMLAGEGTLKPANDGVPVTASVSGLAAGTAYRFRIVATSRLGQDEVDSSFTTLAPVEVSTSCPNQALRTGLSAVLPDCRAYELVTPTDTNGHSAIGFRGGVNGFTTRQVSPDGEKLPFKLDGASLSGLEGTGSYNSDPYLATRTDSGWSTSYVGPSAQQSPAINPGVSSPDQGYLFWEAEGTGNPAMVSGERTAYVRYPDGHSEVLGQSSYGVEPQSNGRLITEGGSHIVFETGAGGFIKPAVPLAPGAAPEGTTALYDRTPQGLYVVSLKPGDVPFGAGEEAFYEGASADGVDIAFQASNTLYVRHADSETFKIGEGVQFAGVAEGGGRVFYVEGGNLKAFDVAREASIAFSQSGDVTPVMVAGDGRVAYFVSPSVLSTGSNPNGEQAQAGQQNLYRSEEGQVAFVGTVTEVDMQKGLGAWDEVLREGNLGYIPARTTPDGKVLLFASSAQLTGYNSEGHAEIYRYDAASNGLACLSCNPAGPASSDATLEYQGYGRNSLYDVQVLTENLRADGRRAFFESSEGLVADDTDGLTDVYEWEDQGVGSCTKPGGCISLISPGNSSRDERLWAVSKSGNDVFFVSSDLLTGEDIDETPSVYDARVDGGFAPKQAPAAECLGEACQPAPGALGDLTPGSFTFQGLGNVKAGSPRIVHRSKHHKKHKKSKKHKKLKRHGRRIARHSRGKYGKGRNGR